MKKFHNSMLACMLLAVMALMASCSGSNNEALSMIPSDKAIVANVNFEKLMENFDCQVKDGQLVVGESMGAFKEEIDRNREEVSNMLALAETVNYKSVFMVLDQAGNGYGMVEIKDKDHFAEALKNKMDFEDATAEAPFEAAYEKGSNSVLVLGNIAWIAEMRLSKLTETVKADLDNAKNGNLADMGSISDFMGKSDDMAKVLVSMKGIGQTVTGAAAYVTADINVKNNALVMECAQYNEQYEEAQPVGPIKIDDNALSYIPANFNIIMAAGIGKDYPWDNMFTALSAVAGRDVAGAIEMVKPYVKAIDGTLLIGCALDATSMAALNRSDLSGFPFLAMVKMTDDKAQGATSLLNQFFSSAGINPTPGANGLSCINVQGLTLNFGVTDGYLTIADTNVAAGQSNPLVGAAKGKKFFAAVKINSLQDVGADVNWGIDLLIVDTDDNESTATLKLVGTDAKILPAIVTAIANN